MTISLMSVQVLLPVYLATAVLAIVVLVVTRRSWRAHLLAVVIGAGVGAAASWWFGDVVDVVGIAPTWVDRLWIGAACALLGTSLIGLIRGRLLGRIVAGVLVPLVLTSSALAINRDAGLFPTIADALGQSHVPALRLPAAGAPAERQANGAQWKPPPGMPVHGRYGTVRINGTASHFSARPAIVYLPPAALVHHAPKLPVVVMLSGQGPGAAPANVIEAGRMVARLDAIASQHHSLAPIVVIPDQLAVPTNNPMCLDGPLGNSASYLTKDVPAWIHAHLNVANGARNWAISGFSQGGTCALQLGASHPDVFGSLIDVSGQLGPTLSTTADTIARGFAGDESRYAAAQPLRILGERAPYRDSSAFFAVGAADSRYGPVLPKVSAAAQASGMHVTRRIVPNSGHDWHTAGVALADGVSWFMGRTQLMSR